LELAIVSEVLMLILNSDGAVAERMWPVPLRARANAPCGFTGWLAGRLGSHASRDSLRERDSGAHRQSPAMLADHLWFAINLLLHLQQTTKERRMGVQVGTFTLPGMACVANEIATTTICGSTREGTAAR
jgi:hypothetical protein